MSNWVNAIMDNDIDTLRSILVKGLDPDATNELNQTPLYIACMFGRYEIYKLLVMFKRDVNKGRDMSTPLHVAACCNHLRIVTSLILNGASVNSIDDRGETPLFSACSAGHDEVVKVLLDSGADIDLENNNGITPLMAAFGNERISTVEVLRKYDVPIDPCDIEDVFDEACLNHHTDTIDYIIDNFQGNWLERAVAAGETFVVDHLVNEHNMVIEHSMIKWSTHNEMHDYIKDFHTKRRRTA